MNTINIKELLKKYKNGWVAVMPNSYRFVAGGKTLEEVLNLSKKKGLDNPIVFKPASTRYLYVG